MNIYFKNGTQTYLTILAYGKYIRYLKELQLNVNYLLRVLMSLYRVYWCHRENFFRVENNIVLKAQLNIKNYQELI